MSSISFERTIEAGAVSSSMEARTCRSGSLWILQIESVITLSPPLWFAFMTFLAARDSPALSKHQSALNPHGLVWPFGISAANSPPFVSVRELDDDVVVACEELKGYLQTCLTRPNHRKCLKSCRKLTIVRFREPSARQFQEKGTECVTGGYHQPGIRQALLAATALRLHTFSRPQHSL